MKPEVAETVAPWPLDAGLKSESVSPDFCMHNFTAEINIFYRLVQKHLDL